MLHRRVHDDSLLISMTDTVDIGYAASDTKPDLDQAQNVTCDN